MQNLLRHRRRHNGRGMSALAETVITLILIGLVIWGSIVLYGKWSNGGKQLLQCKTQEGICTPGTCDWKTQIPLLGSKIAGCNIGEICCVPRDKGQQIDPLCMDAEGNEPLPFGNDCGIDMYCNAAQVCVDKCTFCSTNVANKPNVAKVEEICQFTKNQAAKKTFENGGMFSCSCNLAQCDASPKACVKGAPYYCGESTTDYCCVAATAMKT